MRERETEIESTKEKMNTVEDKVFAKFCQSIGVQNIRYVAHSLDARQTLNFHFSPAGNTRSVS